MTKTAELERELAAAQKRIDELERPRAPYVPFMTEYEKFVAEGRGGLKEWKAWNRRIAREHW